MNVQTLAVLGGTGLLAAYCLTSTIYTVQPGHVALKFSRFTGLGERLYREGWNFRIPYFERPIVFNIQTRPTNIKSFTANRGNLKKKVFELKKGYGVLETLK